MESTYPVALAWTIISPEDCGVASLLLHASNKPGGKDSGESLATEYVALSIASKLAYYKDRLGGLNMSYGW